ncbi:energy-coupling factor transporter transmembrane component T [Proteinivorax tanatarense]|uniref:Energy-coupling factor transporter transmembrane component T n=1 Tax=Proteinivorax tanatarense TaxID=1260629 RepID=A0AAU7VJL3_9FIRM
MKDRSWAEQWEVRIKISTIFVTAFMIISLENILIISIVFLQCLALLMSSKFSLKFIFKKILLPLPFLLFMAFPLLIGQGFKVTLENIQFISLIFGKSLSVFLLMLLLMFTEKDQELLWGLSHLKLPKTICSVLFISYRYLFIFKETIKNCYKSIVSRGFSPRADLKTIKIYGEVMGGVILRSIGQSERLYNSMKSRGFSKEFYVPSPQRIHRKDWIIGCGIIINVLCLILIDKW